MNPVVCLITGVTLQNDAGLCKPADLFQLNDKTWVVNATGEGRYYTPADSMKVARYFEGDPSYFERRNVYVFPREALVFNQAALDYIRRSYEGRDA